VAGAAEGAAAMAVDGAGAGAAGGAAVTAATGAFAGSVAVAAGDDVGAVGAEGSTAVWLGGAGNEACGGGADTTEGPVAAPPGGVEVPDGAFKPVVVVGGAVAPAVVDVLLDELVDGAVRTGGAIAGGSITGGKALGALVAAPTGGEAAGG
jgi:hypothetical protein